MLPMFPPMTPCLQLHQRWTLERHGLSILMLPLLWMVLTLPVLAWTQPSKSPSGERNGWWGQVQHVSDGDTVWLVRVPTRVTVKVRLAGFDAPEICQHWGPQARQALTSLLANGRWVMVWPQGKDVYERMVGAVWVNGQDVAAWMVFHGHAWADPHNPRLMALQLEAQRQGRGLFGSPAALPKDFRRWRGPCHGA